MNVELQNWLEGMVESFDVPNQACDDCGVVGQSRSYADGHIFVLCHACAWKQTGEYHANGLRAPWEGQP